MRNHHVQRVNPLFLWPFSIAILDITRGYPFHQAIAHRASCEAEWPMAPSCSSRSAQGSSSWWTKMDGLQQPKMVDEWELIGFMYIYICMTDIYIYKYIIVCMYIYISLIDIMFRHQFDGDWTNWHGAMMGRLLGRRNVISWWLHDSWGILGWFNHQYSRKNRDIMEH